MALGAGVVWAAIVIAAMPARAAAPTAWAPGLVRAPGGPYLLDSLGRRLELHGVNLVGKCGGGTIDSKAAGSPCVGVPWGRRLAYVLSPTAPDPGRRFTAADAATLAGMGFDLVRLGIVWEGMEPGPRNVGPNDPTYCAPHKRGTPFPSLGRADPYDAATVRAYLARTDVIVRLLAAAGIRVIIDMHSDAYGSVFRNRHGATPWNGEGAPPWATCTGRHRFVAPPNWGAAYLTPAVQVAIHHFWANDVRANLQGQYARVLAAVARHFRGNQDVLGYEPANEPNDYLVKHFDPELECDYGGAALEPASCAASRAQPVPGGLIGAIRAADRSHVVFYEPDGSTNFGARETVGIGEPLRFSNLALAFHVYGSVRTILRLVGRERGATVTRQSAGPAWIMDEFGAADQPRPVAATVDDAAVLNLSWAYWAAFQLHDPTGGSANEGLLNERTRKPYPAMQAALSVPYPEATAGLPGTQTFSRATGTFRYRYVVDPRVRAPTEIALPANVYPHGYTVSATGATVVSAAGAPLLLLAADPGARRVAVTVTRAPAAP
ncbi:MAG: glycoside hydrolase family 5 protein [Solirubrobacteraceae bacterium]